MAHLYKKPTVRTDPKTGRKVKGLSKKWWIQFRDHTGNLRRYPLSTDKKSAQAALARIVRQVERAKLGLVDAIDEQRQRPLNEHIEEFNRYMENRDITEKQVQEVLSHVRKMVAFCGWKRITEISSDGAMQFLGHLRRQGLSAQTLNRYASSSRHFTGWLIRNERAVKDPLICISRFNVKADRRHDRRPLSPDEFARLLVAAHTGPLIETIPGADRAMLYRLASWTGLRKGELGSLACRSLCLNGEPPTVVVAAAYSKRRREDVQVLHPELACQLNDWLAEKRTMKSDGLLFPISGRVPGGTERRTCKMMRRDLERARQAWIEEAETGKEKKRRREDADYLMFRNSEGLFADFHSNRHLFITSLERAGISPRMAQSLARHSDIRLTMSIYTHLERADQTAAIAALPAPPQRQKGA